MGNSHSEQFGSKSKLKHQQQQGNRIKPHSSSTSSFNRANRHEQQQHRSRNHSPLIKQTTSSFKQQSETELCQSGNPRGLFGKVSSKKDVELDENRGSMGAIMQPEPSPHCGRVLMDYNEQQVGNKTVRASDSLAEARLSSSAKRMMMTTPTTKLESLVEQVDAQQQISSAEVRLETGNQESAANEQSSSRANSIKSSRGGLLECDKLQQELPKEEDGQLAAKNQNQAVNANLFSKRSQNKTTPIGLLNRSSSFYVTSSRVEGCSRGQTNSGRLLGETPAPKTAQSSSALARANLRLLLGIGGSQWNSELVGANSSSESPSTLPSYGSTSFVAHQLLSEDQRRRVRLWLDSQPDVVETTTREDDDHDNDGDNNHQDDNSSSSNNNNDDDEDDNQQDDDKLQLQPKPGLEPERRDNRMKATDTKLKLESGHQMDKPLVGKTTTTATATNRQGHLTSVIGASGDTKKVRPEAGERKLIGQVDLATCNQDLGQEKRETNYDPRESTFKTQVKLQQQQKADHQHHRNTQDDLVLPDECSLCHYLQSIREMADEKSRSSTAAGSWTGKSDKQRLRDQSFQVGQVNSSSKKLENYSDQQILGICDNNLNKSSPNQPERKFQVRPKSGRAARQQCSARYNRGQVEGEREDNHGEEGEGEMGGAEEEEGERKLKRERSSGKVCRLDDATPPPPPTPSSSIASERSQQHPASSGCAGADRTGRGAASSGKTTETSEKLKSRKKSLKAFRGFSLDGTKQQLRAALKSGTKLTGGSSKSCSTSQSNKSLASRLIVINSNNVSYAIQVTAQPSPTSEHGFSEQTIGTKSEIKTQQSIKNRQDNQAVKFRSHSSVDEKSHRRVTAATATTTTTSQADESDKQGSLGSKDDDDKLDEIARNSDKSSGRFHSYKKFLVKKISNSNLKAFLRRQQHFGANQSQNRRPIGQLQSSSLGNLKGACRPNANISVIMSSDQSNVTGGGAASSIIDGSELSIASATIDSPRPESTCDPATTTTTTTTTTANAHAKSGKQSIHNRLRPQSAGKQPRVEFTEPPGDRLSCASSSKMDTIDHRSLMETVRLNWQANQNEGGATEITSVVGDAEASRSCGIAAKRLRELTAHLEHGSVPQSVLYETLEFAASILDSVAMDQIRSDTALLYNDRAVLENFHICQAFTLMRNEDCNILAGLSKDEFREFRSLVIDMVLATDMSSHFQQIKAMKTILNHSDNFNSDKSKILSLVIHISDISHPAKEWELHSQWTGFLMEEFFRQGDREKELNLECSPLCDRETTLVAESQLGFIEFIVSPSLEICGDVLDRVHFQMAEANARPVLPASAKTASIVAAATTQPIANKLPTTDQVAAIEASPSSSTGNRDQKQQEEKGGKITSEGSMSGVSLPSQSSDSTASSSLTSSSFATSLVGSSETLTSNLRKMIVSSSATIGRKLNLSSKNGNQTGTLTSPPPPPPNASSIQLSQNRDNRRDSEQLQQQQQQQDFETRQANYQHPVIRCDSSSTRAKSSSTTSQCAGGANALDLEANNNNNNGGGGGSSGSACCSNKSSANGDSNAGHLMEPIDSASDRTHSAPANSASQQNKQIARLSQPGELANTKRPTVSSNLLVGTQTTRSAPPLQHFKIQRPWISCLDRNKRMWQDRAIVDAEARSAKERLKQQLESGANKDIG